MGIGSICCIVGINCNNWIKNTKENFKRCKIDNSFLIVVENGNGIGLWGDPGPNEVVIQSDVGASEYINAGLEYIRKNGSPDDWFVKFDSDDYYGKNRLKQIKKVALNGYVACGASNIIVKTENDKMLLIGDSNSDSCIIKHIPHGPTLAGRISHAIDFPKPNEDWGEDAMWVNAMRESGVVFGQLPYSSFAYVRHNEGTHTFPIPNDLIRHIWVEKAYDIGEWDEEVVEGDKPISYKKEIPFDVFKMHEACEHMLNLYLSK